MKPFYINTLIRIILCCLSTGSWVLSQLYTSADPYYLLLNEKAQFEKGKKFHSTAMRPFYQSNGKKMLFSIKNEFYLNNNAPNQENMDVRYFGNTTLNPGRSPRHKKHAVCPHSTHLDVVHPLNSCFVVRLIRSLVTAHDVIIVPS